MKKNWNISTPLDRRWENMRWQGRVPHECPGYLAPSSWRLWVIRILCALLLMALWATL